MRICLKQIRNRVFAQHSLTFSESVFLSVFTFTFKVFKFTDVQIWRTRTEVHSSNVSKQIIFFRNLRKVKVERQCLLNERQ